MYLLILIFIIILLLNVVVFQLKNKKYRIIGIMITLGFIIFYVSQYKRYIVKEKPVSKQAYWDPVQQAIFNQMNDQQNLELFLRQTSQPYRDGEVFYPYDIPTAEKALEVHH